MINLSEIAALVPREVLPVELVSVAEDAEHAGLDELSGLEEVVRDELVGLD